MVDSLTLDLAEVIGEGEGELEAAVSGNAQSGAREEDEVTIRQRRRNGPEDQGSKVLEFSIHIAFRRGLHSFHSTQKCVSSGMWIRSRFRDYTSGCNLFPKVVDSGWK